MQTLALNPITGNLDEARVGEPRTGIMTITPQQATQILADRNTHNRKVSPIAVTRLARDMANGDFLMNGDAIRFAADGTLLDGQHRLHACVKSGATIRTVVVWNLPSEAQATMDDGNKRTMSHVLQLDGRATKHSQTVASILRRVILLERGSLTSTTNAPTKTEMSDYLDAHPGVTEAAIVADQVRNARGVRCAPSTLGVAYFLFSQKSPAKAAEFFELLRTGAGLEEGSPILALRNRLSVDGSTRHKTESPEVLAWFIKAWNAWRAGKSLRVLRQKSNDKWPEVR